LPDVVSSVATAVGAMPSGLHPAPIPDAKRAAEAALSVHSVAIAAQRVIGRYTR
jgi:hypothetical protein